MKRILYLSVLLIVVGCIIFFSCSKRDESCDRCNKPPIPGAGLSQVITLPTDSVSLDGSASRDPDGKISEWLWTKISGPASYNIVSPETARTIVNNLDTGIYRFELKVTDNGGLSVKDTLQVTVNSAIPINHPPIANAGVDQAITLPTNSVDLDGRGSFDPDSSVMSYLWTKIAGPYSVNISSVNAVHTQVTNFEQGVYHFELEVKDVGGLSSKDTVQVIVLQIPTPSCEPLNRPIINAQLIPFGNLSQARTSIAAVSAGDKIFFAGGFVSNSGASSRVDIYDIATQNWSTAELSTPRAEIAAIASGNKIFFAGGTDYPNYSSRVDIYDLTTESWSVANLSEARTGIAAAAVGDKVLFAGGMINPGGPFSSKVDIYDLATLTWTTAELSEPKSRFTGITANNKIYFAGGRNWTTDCQLINRIDIYDNATGTWSVSLLTTPRMNYASVFNDGKIYWAGGITDYCSNGDPTTTCQVEIRDVNTQTTAVTNLSNRTYDEEDECKFKAFVVNNKIVYFPGFFGLSASLGMSFDIYDIVTNSWSVGIVDQPMVPNYRIGSSISIGNSIYVAGGHYWQFGSDQDVSQVWKLEF